MEAIIVNFRQGRTTQKENHMILKVEGVDSKDKAAKLLEKKVTWKSPAGKEIKGIIKSAHGNKGALRAIFEKGMPGQAIGSKVKVE
ncbi:50S ribosomal protein L35ae [Candidatus Woesearchaeota archaeon CG10_big_fil_rev_8_21_14_0_10_44_13]|nr:MAG: 50S ribosomal protein L35ae [Candidatus Woesearchaeota archaeon CG10_big_fil_rev_8_21_14_0_10_44_13]